MFWKSLFIIYLSLFSLIKIIGVCKKYCWNHSWYYVLDSIPILLYVHVILLPLELGLKGLCEQTDYVTPRPERVYNT